MLSGLDLRYVGFWRGDGGSDPVCRECAVKALGEHTVQRLEARMSAGVSEWEPMLRYEAQEQATEMGYEMVDGCGEGARCGAKDTPNGRFCEECAQVCCFDCGKRLDDGYEEATDAA